jgi:hypothetical protein
LAVTNYGSVTIYKQAKGRPTRYTDARISVYDYDAYDGQGNLFVDGHSKNHAPIFAELLRGSRNFALIKIDKNVGQSPTTLQWLNNQLAVSTLFGHKIFQVDISGSKGTVVGSTSLGNCGPIDTYIFARTAISNCGALNVFKYPGGAPPIKVYQDLGARQALVGLVISK